ncbi:MAG: hypothetical protein ACKVU1_01930 [bacterium]
MSAAKISASMRIVYAAFAAAIVITVMYKMLFIPELAAARAREVEIASLRGSLEEVESRLARLREEARDPRVRQEIERLVSTDSSPNEALRSLIDEFARRHAASECEFQSFGTDLAVVAAGGTEETPFRASVVARYDALLALLRELEAAYPSVHIRSVAFTALPERGYAAKAEIAGALFVIR